MIKSLSKIKKQNKDKFKVPKSAQDVVDVEVIYKDGIFKIGNRYTKTYRFKDINYSIASKEEKVGLFLDYSDLLNSLDSSTMTKITINNRKIDLNEFKENVLIPFQNDGLDEYRKEYNKMLMDKISSTDEIIQEKYITITAFKNSIEDARAFFQRTSVELSSHLGKLGSNCEELNAMERLKILHDFYRNGEEENFYFDMEEFARKGHHFKDSICPRSPVFKHKYFQLGDKYGRVLYLSEYARYIKDSFVAELCGLNKNMMYSMDLLTIPTDEAVKEVENKLLGVETNITNWQRRQNANNNFSAVIPYDMEQQRKESKEFLDDLTVRDQKMIFANITVVHLANSKEELDADSEVLMSIARKYMCDLTPIAFSSRQLDGLSTALPIGVNRLDIMRTLLTESASIFIPFRAQEVMDKGGIWYGQNAITNNLIMCNKELLLNPNSFILGVPGAGKSFLTKELIIFLALATNDDIIVCDPEGEYSTLIRELNGQVHELYVGSPDHINAMDMEEGYGDSANPIGDKSQFIMTLIDQNSKNGITEEEESLIDRCVTETYRRCENTGEVPTLRTLREILLKQKEREARGLALKLELFTEGNLNIFAQETNVQRTSRITSFDIRRLQKQLKKIGLSVITDTMINRVNANWRAGRRTHLFYDEIHVIFENEAAANFLDCAWRQFRKRDAFPTGITQNAQYLLASVQASTMLSNSECIVMLNQAYQDRQRLGELLNISDEQMSYITNAQEGCGLIKYGSSLVPFINCFPKHTKLYKLMTTKPTDRKE
ncbi:DUF87 domain-containing protein [[Clostridium] innocuum]|nr:DUF87 domain-containing protein [[Clostridium] innocuum]